jgi:XapX domain-containing protein
MDKIILGLLLGFLIGVGCRYFDIPLPGPEKLVGALVILSVTLGYLGMDYLLNRPSGLPPSP